MPLPSSGPLSLNDIQTEFGGTNPISLSEYYAGGGLVPAGTTGTNGAVPSSGTISIFNFYGTSNIVYWINQLATSLNYQAITVNSSGDAFVAGGSTATLFSGRNYGLLVRLNAAGSLVWQTAEGNSSGILTNFQGVSLDSSGNVYLIAPYNNTSTPANAQIYVKTNSSGTVQWRRQTSFVVGPQAMGVAATGAGDAYFVGNTESGVNAAFVVKLDTTGTFSWARTLANTSPARARWDGVALDTSGNVCVAGTSHYQSSAVLGVYAEYNSAGTIQWQRTIASTAYSSVARGIATDSSNNLLIVGNYQTAIATNNLGLLFKTDTTGAVTWQRSASGTSAVSFQKVAVDSSGNAYVTAFDLGSTGLFILKYNSSGTLQWQRSITASAGGLATYGLAVSSSGVIYVSTWNTNNSNALVFKLPTDGSKTGTYTVGSINYTYAASSLTVGTPTYSYPSSAYTDASATPTINTPASTAGTPTFTSTTVTI